MTIKGIGVDIEEVARFQKRPYSKNRSFYEKIFSKKEITYCLKSPSPAASFAARFAAKEACVKAAGGLIKIVSQVEVVMQKNKPTIIMKKRKIFLSLSHTKTHAIAIVLCMLY